MAARTSQATAKTETARKGSHKERIETALKNNETVLLIARCEITYDGRAKSFLGSGDRIILIKSDKTILIHQPEGSTPINYMKAGAQHTLEQVDGTTAFTIKSQLEKEYLDIFVEHVHTLETRKLDDKQKITLVGSERDMADMLYANPQLIEKGFKPLSREEHTKFGFIDLFGTDAHGTLVVVECKRYVGSLSAVTQLRRYVEKIKETKGLAQVRGVLACPTISPNAERMLNAWGFSYVRVEPPQYLEKHVKNQKKLGEY